MDTIEATTQEKADLFIGIYCALLADVSKLRDEVRQRYERLQQKGRKTLASRDHLHLLELEKLLKDHVAYVRAEEKRLDTTIKVEK